MQIRSIQVARLRRKLSDKMGSYPIDRSTVISMKNRIRSRSEQAWRLVNILDRMVENEENRLVMQYVIMTAADTLPLEKITERSYLSPLEAWWKNRKGTAKNTFPAFYAKGVKGLVVSDPELMLTLSEILTFRLGSSHRLLTREFMAIIACASQN